jgi:predicted TIM-barrel fold metal-dependent hydrolase
MKQGFRIFDAHAHLGTARHSGRIMNLDSMLRHMDMHGIDRSLLIPFPVVDNEQAAHDEIAAAVRAYPERFRGAACVNPWSPRFQIEVDRCAQVLGLKVLKLQPQYHGLNPISRRSEFYFEAVLKHKMTLLVHTGAGAPFALPSLYMAPATRFPELPIVLGHAGGGLYAAEAIVAASLCPNIYVELSSLMPHHVHEVLTYDRSSRLMIGSDLPESADTEFGKILDLDCAERMKQDILWNTAEALFK